MSGYSNPFADSDPLSFVTKFVGGAESKILDTIKDHPMATAIALIVAVVVIVIMLVIIVWMMTKSGFGNGRLAGSGTGRNNQLQRAQTFDLPLSQPELDSYQAEQQRIVGTPMMSTYDPPMENIYAGFGDKSYNPHVDVPQLRPQYPEGGQQEPFNDNVLLNVAYD